MKKWVPFASGVVVGCLLCAGFTATAWAVSGTNAVQVTQLVRMDGRQVELNAYEIEDSNYVKLRDVGELVGFNVYWNDGIFIDSASPYTGEPPEEVVQAIQVPASGSPEKEIDTENIRQKIVRLTNELREEKGLSALTVDEKLMEAAQVRADEMAATGVYDHIRPDGRSRSTVTDCLYTTENIHRINARRLADAGKELAKVAVEDWAASKIHLEAMLDTRRSAIGVGIARGVDPDSGKESWYCVQWFLRTGYSITEVDEPVLDKK